MGLPSDAAADNGYRMVHPRKRSAAKEPHRLADPVAQERRRGSGTRTDLGGNRLLVRWS